MKLDESFGFIVNQAGRKMTQLLNLRFQAHDITTEQWTVLNRLTEQDGISQKELAKRAEKDQTNLTRILDQLERKDLVARHPNLQDRRSFLIYVTERGRKLNNTLEPIENEVICSLVEGISEAEMLLLRKLLVQVTGNAVKQIHGVEERL